MSNQRDFDDQVLRDALGRFCTGVTIVAATIDGVPVGLAVQSFTALSLDPPQVLLCPMKSSSSWARIAHGDGSFAVSILADSQSDISATFGVRNDEKFDAVDWHPDHRGNPRITGALAHFDCQITHTHDAGDHWIVVAAIRGLNVGQEAGPLLFFRGTYRAFDPDQGPTWQQPGRWI